MIKTKKRPWHLTSVTSSDNQMTLEGKCGVNSWTALEAGMSSMLSSASAGYMCHHGRTMTVSLLPTLFAISNWFLFFFEREKMSVSFDKKYDVSALHYSLHGVYLLPAWQWMA